MAADLRDAFPDGVEITGAAVLEACQGLADLVLARRVVHPGDALLDKHVLATAKLPSGDRWRFTPPRRRPVDAAYAAAGAAHVARTMPAPRNLDPGGVVIVQTVLVLLQALGAVAVLVGVGSLAAPGACAR